METWTTSAARHPRRYRVLLYWLPLGAGGHVVGWNGRRYEALARERAGLVVR